MRVRLLSMLLTGPGLIVLAGCGTTDRFAGMTREEARETALLGGIARETHEPRSPLLHRRLELVGVHRGRPERGDKAWVAAFRDLAGGHLCMRLWAKVELTVETVAREIDRCGPQPLVPEAQV